MAADANLFQQYLKPPKSVQDYQADYDQADARKNALQLASLDLSEKTLANQDQRKVRNVLESLAGGSTVAERAAALRASGTPLGYTQADALEKGDLERKKIGSEIGKNDQANASAKLTDSIKAHDFHLQQLGGVTDPESAKSWAIAGLQSGVFTPEQFKAGFSNIPTDPAGFAQWKQTAMQGGMTATEQLKQAQAKLIADERNKTQITTTGMTNATSRANNRDTIAAENVRAGVVPGGGVDENSERTAQAIASGQLPAPTGMALLNPKNQRILGRVMEINPQYDATTVSAKKTAAASFASGPLGNALRSVSTANAHLDQLGELADALDNGNTQVVNKVQNYFSKATGSPNVTNFDAIKAIVGQEVVKAIVAGGGGVGEREEAAKIFSSASSPAQLKGAIQHYRMVMGAQANNLMEQRRAAGLPDTTLPDYSKTNATAQAPTVPSDIAAILQKHGGK